VKLGFDLARARDANWLFTTHRIPPHAPQHVQDQYFEFLDAMAVPHGEARWNLRPAEDERAAARKLVEPAQGPLVGFVVATSKPDKNWLPQRFAEVATRLHAEVGARCVLLGGTTPLEVEAAKAIEAATTATPINALGSGLRTLLGLLDLCDLVIAPDTGPYHVCIAMGVPAVGLFGYTNPKRVGPYRRFTELMIDGYGDPGEDYPISMAYRPGRMSRITVAPVLERARAALARYAPGPPWRRARPPG
jgi:heptosyltransferase I